MCGFLCAKKWPLCPLCARLVIRYTHRQAAAAGHNIKIKVKKGKKKASGFHSTQNRLQRMLHSNLATAKIQPMYLQAAAVIISKLGPKKSHEDLLTVC